MMCDPKIKGGFILLSRKLIESEIFKKPPLYLKVWIYLLSKAQHSDYKKLTKGQLITNIPEIQDACAYYVGYRKVKPSKDNIYKIIDFLRSACEGNNEGDTKATMITTTKATQHLLINIDNYSFYQDIKNYESNNESNDEGVTKATRKQRHANNINKNDKNDNNVQECKDNITPKTELIFNLFSTKFKPIANSKEIEGLRNYIAQLGEDLVLEAFNRSLDRGIKKWAYCTAILDDWIVNNITTLEQAQKESKPWEKKGGGPSEINRPNNKWNTSEFLYKDDGKSIEGDDKLM